MGEREATVEQLDAMQEPLRRERMQHQQQEDYFDRVRAKAEERAREILGAAYAERQKVLEEARVEAQELNKRLTHESAAIKAQAQEERNQAQAELAQAQALRQEAQVLRENGQADGFQAGMDQSGQELKEFRAEIGQALGTVLHALDRQRHAICESWREQLALLTQEAVTAGIGWMLEKEHKKILQSLVFEALNLLEDRATITLRVHPDDEETVSDMFMAARERVPELQQWVVSGDPSVGRGGLLAESVSGSVDCRRELYTELVNGVLSCLTLGPGQDDQRQGEAVSQLVRQEAERIAALSPEMEQASAHGAHVDGHAGQPDVAGYDEQSAGPAHADPLDVELPPGLPGDLPEDLPEDLAEDLAQGLAGDLPADLPEDLTAAEATHVPETVPETGAGDPAGGTAVAPQGQDSPFLDSPRQDLPATDEPALTEDHHGPISDAEALMVEEPEWTAAQADASAPAERWPSEEMHVPSAAGVNQQAGSESPGQEPGAATAAPAGQQGEDYAPAAPAQSAGPSHGAASMQAPAGPKHAGQKNAGQKNASQKNASPKNANQEMTAAAQAHPSGQAENPTLAELEDELFPLEVEAEESGLAEHLSARAFAPSDGSGLSGLGGLSGLDGLAGPDGTAGPDGKGGHDDQDVFSQGGFLPGADKGR